MPCASAPNAPWVEVWLSPQTMVVPGRVKPCSGPMTWTMPWRLSNSLKYSMPNSLAFSAITRICSMLSGSGLGFERSVVGMLWSTTASVFSGADHPGGAPVSSACPIRILPPSRHRAELETPRREHDDGRAVLEPAHLLALARALRRRG